MEALLLLATINLPACGDDLRHTSPTIVMDAPIDSPPDGHALTWGEAENEWSMAWCVYAEHCFPKEFSTHFLDQVDCIKKVTTSNCADDTNVNRPCSSAYPSKRYELLNQCIVDMGNIDCMVTMAPDSCMSAFDLCAVDNTCRSISWDIQDYKHP